MRVYGLFERYDDAKLFTRNHFSCADIMDLIDFVGDTFCLPNEKAQYHQCFNYLFRYNSLRTVAHIVYYSLSRRQAQGWVQIHISNTTRPNHIQYFSRFQFNYKLRMERIFDWYSNIGMFSCYSIRIFAACKYISFQYFSSCTPP